jgi:DeoR family transcriptional regulator of aga operon
MSAVSRYERWNTLIELIAADGHLSVTEAARSPGVSEVTIRRDPDQLAEDAASGSQPPSPCCRGTGF